MATLNEKTKIVDREIFQLKEGMASLNEAKVALAAGFPPERMTAHGNNKEREYLQLCVDNGVAHVVLDNEGELALLDDIARAAGRVQPVMIRVQEY